MKLLSCISLVVLFIACNTPDRIETPTSDTTTTATLQNKEGVIENNSDLNTDNPIEVRLDKIKPLLVKNLSVVKINAIESQLTSAIASSNDTNDEKIFTPALKHFLDEMPDDIMIEMDPEAVKDFKKKWGKTHDVHNINFMHPFYDGNGGCTSTSLSNFTYLGTYNQAYFVEVSIICKMDSDKSSFRRYFKVIEDGDSFKIDGIYQL